MIAKRVYPPLRNGLALCIAFSLAWLLNMGGMLSTDAAAAGKPSPQSTISVQMVDFNTNTHKFHHPQCRWAVRCTRNCIRISRSEAIQRGGIPCKVCGGG